MAIDLDHLVVSIRVMTPGIWAIDLDHLVVIIRSTGMTRGICAIDLDHVVVIMMTRLLTDPGDMGY